MEENIHQSDDNHIIPMTSIAAGKGREAAPDVFYYTNQIVNLIFIGKPSDNSWVLIDAGMPKSGSAIVAAAKERFGSVKPAAILLTHGHFDHIGSIVHLLQEWPGTPVYAHELEFPFLTGQQAYPEPDSTVEGGLLAKISKLYPVGPIDITPVLHELPPDGNVPMLPEWKWIHTPGHSPGHASFFRAIDRILIAGDAFVTVRQDSFYKVLIQKEEVHGPPPYLTTDWLAARDSVRVLESLYPEVAVTGHGTHMEGDILRKELKNLAENFDTVALPSHGKYVEDSDREKNTLFGSK